MKVLLLNLSLGDQYIKLGKALEKDLRDICRCHSDFYSSVLFHASVESSKPSTWRKIEEVSFQLDQWKEKIDWIIWIDSDVVVVDNKCPVEKLLDCEHDLLLSADCFGICMGMFAIRNTRWSREFLHTLLFLGNTNSVGCDNVIKYYRYEQDCVKELICNYPSVRKHIDIIPEELVQNRQSQYSATAWMYHFWMGGRSIPEVLGKRKLIKRKGWTSEVFEDVGSYLTQNLEDVRNVASKLSMSCEELFSLLGVDHIVGKAPPSLVLKREQNILLLRYSDLYDFAVCRFGSRSAALSWLRLPCDILGGRTPLSIGSNGESYFKLESYLRNSRSDVRIRCRLESADNGADIQ
jgi:hypothetical protein